MHTYMQLTGSREGVSTSLIRKNCGKSVIIKILFSLLLLINFNIYPGFGPITTVQNGVYVLPNRKREVRKLISAIRVV